MLNSPTRAMQCHVISVYRIMFPHILKNIGEMQKEVNEGFPSTYFMPEMFTKETILIELKK